MKKTVRLFSLILGFVAVGTFTSFADENDKKPEGKKRGEAAERGKGDGERRGRGPRRELTEEQKAEMEKRRAQFEALRKEHAGEDGKLDETERKAFMEAMMLVRFDKNKDGKLDETEKAAAEEARKQGRGRGRRGPGGQGRQGGPRRGGPGGDKGDKKPDA